MLIEETEAASFFPTAGEVVRAVQFVRENPAVVLGVVVGLTSLSVAKYYEDCEETSEDGTTLLVGEEELQGAHEVTQDADNYSSTGKASQDCSSLAGTDSTDTIACNQTSSNESSSTAAAGTDAAKSCDQLHRNCSFCNQTAACPDSCCDPDWGWFIPTSPEDEHDGHHHALATAHDPHAVRLPEL